MMRALAAAGAALALGWAGSAQGSELLVGAFGHDVTFIGEAIGSGAAGRRGR